MVIDSVDFAPGQLVLSPNLQNAHDITWCPLIQPTSWTIELDTIMLNGDLILTGQTALIDTGTSFIVTTEANMSAMQKIMPGSRLLRSGVNQKMLVACVTDVKGLAFVIQNKVFTISDDDLYMGNVVDGRGVLCVIAIDGLPEGHWILGCRLLSHTTVHFDMSHHRVGLGI
jgi:cathepsin D